MKYRIIIDRIDREQETAYYEFHKNGRPYGMMCASRLDGIFPAEDSQLEKIAKEIMQMINKNSEIKQVDVKFEI